MIQKKIIEYILRSDLIIVRNKPDWIQIEKNEKTNEKFILKLCSKFKNIKIQCTEDFIHILST